MKTIRFIDLFAGIGGFRYGLERANKKYKCVYSNEWDKYASSIYARHFGEIDTSDIRTVKADTIPDFDLLCAGFPCQAFSIAGKRKGFDDTRGTLFFEIARILADKRSRYFILENVKGLLSHDEGKTFQTILGVLTDLGYEYQWQVLNSKNFGVPQNRERVFIIGHLRGKPRPKIFPVAGGNAENTKQVHPTLDANYYKGYSHQRKMINQINQPTHSNDRVYGDNGLSPSLNTMQGGRRQSKVLALDLYNHKAHADRTPTLTEPHHNSLRLMVDTKIRRLTPIECERLQGFPDGWTEGISDTQRYKCLGNAVTTNVVTWIGEQLIK